MTSYLNSLTSHYTSLKRLLPNSLSADSDLQITDPADSHVSRVLRAYYAEKGRPFPPWLGPDPNAPVRPTAAFVTQPNMYGQPAPQQGGAMRNGRGAGGLDDLFGASPSSAPPPRDDPLSLRSRRRMQPAQAVEPQPMARPLPSQRFGSHQQRSGPSSEDSYSQSLPTTREQSAKDRLKARLGGARSASPNVAPQQSSYSSQDSHGGGGSAGSNPYDRGGGGGKGGNPYGNSGGGGGNPYGTSGDSGRYQQAPAASDPYGGSSSSRRGADSKPFVSATAPWASGDKEYGYNGGNDYGGRGSSQRAPAPGLPSNPRRQR